jgi:thioredoxin 1
MAVGSCSGSTCSFEPKHEASDRISSAEFKQHVLDSALPVVVEFHSVGRCGRCRAIAPELERLERAHERRATVFRVDVDENPTLAREHGVGPLPHFVLYEAGKRVASTRPELLPGEARRRSFSEDQLRSLFALLPG